MPRILSVCRQRSSRYSARRPSARRSDYVTPLASRGAHVREGFMAFSEEPRRPANPVDEPSTSTPASDTDNPGPSTSHAEPGPSTSTPAFAHDNPRPSTSYDEPGPSTSTLATAHGRSYDSDWDLSDDDDDLDLDYAPDDDESDLDLEEMEGDDVPLDYVASHDVSIDSDDPLSELARQRSLRNAPGSAGWQGWFREENVPRRHGFSGTPGVDEALGLEED